MKHYQVRIKNKEHYDRLVEEYGLLEYSVIRKGNYAVIQPNRKKKK